MSKTLVTPSPPASAKSYASAMAEASSVEAGEATPPQYPYGRCLAENPLWPDLLAEIAANRQADLERDARDYAE